MRRYNLVLLVGALLCITVTRSSAQWELMTEIYSAKFEDIDCRDGRCIGVLSNGVVVESRLDSLYWREFAVLPSELIRNSRRYFRGRYDVEFSYDGEIYALAGRLWRYLPSEQRWTEVTKGLDTQGKEIRDMAVWKDGVVAVVTDRHLYMTFSYGDFWWEVDADPRLFAAWAYLDNTIQYSPDGNLYFNALVGDVNVSTDHGMTWKRIGNEFGADYPYTRYPLIVADDTTILAVDYAETVKLLDPATNTWTVIRPVEFNDQLMRIGYGTDGTILCLYYSYTKWGTDPGAYQYVNAVSWSVDRGKSWNKRFVGVDDSSPRSIYYPEIVTGDSTRILFAELGGELYEFSFRDSMLVQRSAPIAYSSSWEIDVNARDIFLTGVPPTAMYSIRYRKDGTMLKAVPMGVVLPINVVFPWTNGRHYFLLEEGIETDRFIFGSIAVQSEWRDGPYIDEELCEASQFVLNSREEIVSVDPRGYILNNGLGCLVHGTTVLDNFPGEFISINANDEFFVAALDGHFKLYSRDQRPMVMGDLPTNEDSVVCVCNDAANNMLVLAGAGSYVSHDLGASWHRSLLDNGGAHLQKVIADRRNWFYLLDSLSGIFVSHDRGDSYLPLPLDFDSLDCEVSDITVDSSHIYVSTTGCGVYRMILPSLTGVRDPVATTATIGGSKLYAGNKSWVEVSVPFALDEQVDFRLTDILGRNLGDLAYSVDSYGRTVSVKTGALPAGLYPYIIASGKNVMSGMILVAK